MGLFDQVKMLVQFNVYGKGFVAAYFVRDLKALTADQFKQLFNENYVEPTGDVPAMGE